MSCFWNSLALSALFPLFLWSAITWQEKGPGEFSAAIEISSEDLQLQDRFEVSLTLTFPNNFQIHPEQLKANLLRHSALSAAPFTFLSMQQESLPSAGQIHTTKLHFSLQAEMEGTFPLTFFAIVFTPIDPSQKPVEIISDIFSVHVALAEKGDVSEIRSRPLLTLSPNIPIEMSAENRQQLFESPVLLQNEAKRNREVFQKSEWPWMEVGLLGLTLLFLWLVKKFPIAARRKLPREVQEEAIQAILALQTKKLPSAEYYAALTNILRCFIEEQYHLRASTKTTQEFLEGLTSHPAFTPETRAKLIQFLLSADQVKFARHQPSEREIQEAQASAKQFISAAIPSGSFPTENNVRNEAI